MNSCKNLTWLSRALACGVLGSLAGQAQAEPTPTYREAHRFTSPKPAFLKVISQSDGTDSLFISSFGLTDSSSVFEVKDIATVFEALSTPSMTELTQGLKWPNEVNALDLSFTSNPSDTPAEQKDRYLSVADGFLVPFKQTGGLYLIDRKSGDQYKITQDKGGWFYHRAEAIDWDGDGLKDILTARAKVSLFGGQTQGEFVALINPGRPDTVWRETVITKGPDVMFVTEDLDNDGSPEILAAEFFSQRFAVYSRSASGSYEAVFVDDKVGKAFDVKLGDINADGRLDVLLTNHQNNQKDTQDPALSAIYAYETPSSPETPWVRHTLFQGFKTRQGGMNAGSPGNILVFHPNRNDTSGKPWILVSGDGSQRAHLLRPRSDDSTDWGYDMEVLLEAGCTVGESAAADLDGDGWLELLVPAYDNGLIHILELAKP